MKKLMNKNCAKTSTTLAALGQIESFHNMHHAPLSPPDAPERLQPISRQYITASS
jgi:hypothetical protein